MRITGDDKPMSGRLRNSATRGQNPCYRPAAPPSERQQCTAHTASPVLVIVEDVVS
jgi:hypothetical protein